jgi:hypothetical protein
VPLWHDDFLWLVQARDLHSLGDLLGPGLVMPRPLCTLAFWLGWKLGGTEPAVYHALSLGLYLATALLVHRWVQVLTGSPGAGAAAGLAFLVMEHHWEVLAGASALGDTLAALGMLGSLYGYLMWRRLGGAGRLAASLLLAAAALLSKEPAGTLLGLLVLADLLLAPGPGFLARQVPFWLLAALWGLWHWSLGRWVPVDPLKRAGVSLFEAAAGYGAGLLFGWPVLEGLRDEPWSPLAWLVLTLGYAAALGLAWRRRWRVAVFHLLWIPLTLAPYLVAGFPPYACRYVYVPSLGAAALVGWLWAQTRTGPVRRGLGALLLALGLLHALGLGGRLAAWARRDPLPREQISMPAVPRGELYVYNPPGDWPFVRAAAALYGDLPLARVRELYEVLEKRSLGPDDRVLFWERTSGSFVDITREVRGMLLPVLPLPPQAAPWWRRAVVLEHWDFALPARRALWRPEGLQGLEGAAYRTPGASGRLIGPDLSLPPLNLMFVEVCLRLRSSVPRGAGLEVGWASQRWPGFSPDRLVRQPLARDQEFHSWMLEPASVREFWLGGEVREIYLAPCTAPATVEIRSVTLWGFPRRPRLRAP